MAVLKRSLFKENRNSNSCTDNSRISQEFFPECCSVVRIPFYTNRRTSKKKGVTLKKLKNKYKNTFSRLNKYL